jgi:hypothetical protein
LPWTSPRQRPRTAEFLAAPEFVDLQRRLLHAVQEEVQSPGAHLKKSLRNHMERAAFA